MSARQDGSNQVAPGVDDSCAFSSFRAVADRDRLWPRGGSLVASGYLVYAINSLSSDRAREEHRVSGANVDADDAHVLRSRDVVATTGASS